MRGVSTSWLLVCLIACATIVLPGCGSGAEVASAQEGTPPQHGGTLTVGVGKEPPILNPWLAQGSMEITWKITDGMSDPLVLQDETGAWQPVLAEQVPTIENGLVRRTSGGGVRVVVRIREEAAWQDGTPLRCDDVVFTWQTVIDPKHLLSNRLGWDQITRMTCPDERTVHIDFARPYAMFMSRILALPVLPKHALEGKDFNNFWNDRFTMSSGPFVFGEWQRGVKLVLERNPNYWNKGSDDRPFLDRIVFRFAKDANTLKMQLRMTEADVAFIPPDTNLVAELKATPDVLFDTPPGIAVEQLVFQTEQPPLDNIDVRYAIAYALDRTMINEVVLKGQVPVAQSTMVPTTNEYASQPFERYVPKPEMVEHHMRKAGYIRDGSGPWTKDGAPIHLKFAVAANSVPFRARTTQLMQQQLAEQGIGMSIQFSTPEVLYSNVAPQGRFHLGEWSEPTGAEPAPGLLYHCRAVPRKPQWAGKNRFRYCREDLSALIDRADHVIDPVARGALIRQIDERVARDAVMLPLFVLPDTIAWNKQVGGVVPNTAAYHTWNIENWWLRQ